MAGKTWRRRNMEEAMPLKYYLSIPQISEWEKRLQEMPDDWTPTEEQAKALRMARAQIAHWWNNTGRILTDDEVERVCNALGMRPAEAYDLYRYEDPSKDASEERRARARAKASGYNA
jgi:hypothetical protein